METINALFYQFSIILYGRARTKNREGEVNKKNSTSTESVIQLRGNGWGMAWCISMVFWDE